MKKGLFIPAAFCLLGMFADTADAHRRHRFHHHRNFRVVVPAAVNFYSTPFPAYVAPAYRAPAYGYSAPGNY